MATIYTTNAEYIAQGLQGSVICEEGPLAWPRKGEEKMVDATRYIRRAAAHGVSAARLNAMIVSAIGYGTPSYVSGYAHVRRYACEFADACVAEWAAPSAYEKMKQYAHRCMVQRMMSGGA